MNRIIAGVDEAGRGPLAGRVYAAAVVLGEVKIEGLNDSKKLNEVKREYLYEKIIEKSISYCIAYASPEEIDKYNILQATFIAMNRALDGLNPESYNYVMVDGNKFPFGDKPGEPVVKGDSKIEEIMAASILAKVARDRYMTEMDGEYPQYKFIQHKGYPTKLHLELISQHGVSEIHRKTFKGVKEFV